MLESVYTLAFWQALGAIIWVNLLLSGDNAVVIALAARSLPPRQQKLAVFWGSAAAIVLRVILTVFAVALLQLPWLKLIGGLLLLWIGVKLIVPEEGEENIESSDNLLQAVKTILIADLVMSLDNVIAVAAAAEQGPAETKILLLVVGLGLSIPIVIFGSVLMLKVMGRFPIIITLGAALLGWIAGEIMVTDPALVDWVKANAAWLHDWKVAPAVGAAFVVILGKMIAARHEAEAKEVPVASQAAAEGGARLRVLLPVDGSEESLRATDHLIKQSGVLRAPLEVHLLNVQIALRQGVSSFVSGEQVESYHREEGEKALARARAKLDAAGVKYQAHVLVGEEPGAVIARYAEENKCEQLVMGTRGLGSVAGALLGSAATQVISLVKVPVLLVK
jgi:YjbE family integral membrane protein